MQEVTRYKTHLNALDLGRDICGPCTSVPQLPMSIPAPRVRGPSHCKRKNLFSAGSEGVNHKEGPLESITRLVPSSHISEWVGAAPLAFRSAVLSRRYPSIQHNIMSHVRTRGQAEAFQPQETILLNNKLTTTQ